MRSTCLAIVLFVKRSRFSFSVFWSRPLRVRYRRKKSSRSLSHLLMSSFFYIISVFQEQSLQFLCSVDNIINLIRYVQESQQSPVYKNQNTNPVSFSTFEFSFKQARISSYLLILLRRCHAGLAWATPQTENPIFVDRSSKSFNFHFHQKRFRFYMFQTSLSFLYYFRFVN